MEFSHPDNLSNVGGKINFALKEGPEVTDISCKERLPVRRQDRPGGLFQCPTY
jgi:hypothetical protein